MGLQVVALSNVKPVACTGGDECDDTHWPVGQSRRRRDGMKPGCYVAGRGGKDTGFSIPYSGYNAWRRELCLIALAVEPEAVWEHPRRFHRKPFAELIDFPDCGTFTIGPTTSAKLHADFVAFAAKARKHFLTKKASPEPNVKTQQGVSGKDMGLAAAKKLTKALGGSTGKRLMRILPGCGTYIASSAKRSRWRATTAS